MASERQIAANRRNAQKSTGPKSSAGKRKASGNAYRHGITARRIEADESTTAVLRLSEAIAGDISSPAVGAQAETAAEAILELDRIRRTRRALIDLAMQIGDWPRPEADARKLLRLASRMLKAGDSTSFPEQFSPKGNLDVCLDSDQRVAQAIRHTLPELQLLNQYERRATSRRNKALMAINNFKYQPSVLQSARLAKRSQFGQAARALSASDWYR